MAESFRSRRFRWLCNVFPAFRGTGGRVTYVDPEFREMRVCVPLSWRTRNYVGTIFGGSMYAAMDPFYMIMLIRRLGPGYTVWDKSATIRFKKPGRSTLSAKFVVDDEEVLAIRKALETAPSVDRVYTVDLTDREGDICATVEKTVYIRRKA